MLTNSAFQLTEEQLSRYNAWAAEKAKGFADAEAMESLQIDITFSFTPIGREVVARCGSESLVLEEI